MASAGLILSEAVMNLVAKSAELSVMAYQSKPAFGESFIDEPDQAMFYKGKVNNQDYCFAAFRGTTSTWIDWQQNFDPTTKNICVKTGGTNQQQQQQQQCCTTRNGYFDAFSASYIKVLEEKVRSCAKTCTNKDECLVLTGHSQVRVLHMSNQ
jgi:hypothetical protein